MNVSDVIDPSFSYRLITTFMHFLWQGSLVALLAALGETLLSRTSASRRYTLHVAALTIMIVCVAVTFLKVAAPLAAASVSTKMAPIVPTTQLIVQGHEDVNSSDRPSTLKPPIVGVETPLPELPAAVGTVEIVEPPLVGQERLSGIGRRWQQLQQYSPQIAALYFVCCGMLLVRLVRGTWVAYRLRRLATTVSDDSLIAMLQRQSKELGLRVMPRVAWCAEVSIPLVIGIFKPVILLPVAAASGLSPDQLQALITHEIAHIRRYDLLVNLVQRIVESMLFFHPAVWYISRRISSEREQACDELVLATGCERLRYADALVRMAELSSSLRSLRRTAPATSLAASGANSSEFKRRVLKVLSVPSTSDQQPSRIALLVIMALIVGAAVSASRLHLNLLAQIPPEPTPTAVIPPKGLEFLKSYPKLQGLSLHMTEPQFMEIVKQQELKTRKTVAGDKATHHIALGDGHTLIVMFDQDEKCLGIQRVRTEDLIDESLPLADVVRDFNAENKRLGRGLAQQAVTEDEVIAVIKRDKWQRGDPWSLNEQEITAFKGVAESKRLPKGSYLDVHTEELAETFLRKQLWQVRLMLPAIGHDGFVGLTIRDTLVAEEKIDPKQVAWGMPDAEGLSLGAYLSPKKDTYQIGERVRLRLFVRNEGQNVVGNLTFYNLPTPDAKDFTVTDQTGANVVVRLGHEDWDLHLVAGAMGGVLKPGDSHAFRVLYEISIGGDGSNPLVGRVIDARPGQTLQLKVREHNGNDRERKDGNAEPESGIVTFTVAAADNAEPKPPTEEQKSGATSPPKGLEFLKPYPKLHGLSLDMTEPQFLKIVKQQGLKTKKTGEGDKTAYHMGLGDRLTLIVMFHKDGTCRGIQRIRGEGENVDEKLQPQVSIQDVVRVVDFSKVKVHGHDEESLRQIPELYGPDPENPGSLKMPKNVFPMPLGEHTWLMYPAGSGHFYFEHRPDGTPQSELIYGPIDGDPFEVLKLDDLFRERLKPGAREGDPQFRLTLMFGTGDPQLIRRAWRLIEPRLNPKSSDAEKGSADAEPAARYSDRDEWRGQRLESLWRVREALRDEADAFRKPELADVAKQMRETVAAVEAVIDAINDSVPDESYQSATYLQPKFQGRLPDTQWGKPVSGLRLGLVPTNSRPTGADWNTLPADASLPTRIRAESGEPLHYLLMVENVSDHEIKFSGYVTGEDHGRSIEIMDRHSKPMMHSSLHTSIWHDISHWRLKPGERKLLTMPAVYFHRETLSSSHTGLGYHVTVPDGRYSLRCSVYFGRLDQERHRHVPGKSEWIGKLTTGTQTITFGVGGTDAPATTPAVGLDFLKPYPKLHGLSLDMTEPQFLKIVKQQELKTRKTVEGEKVTHHIGLGDGHSLIVMFDKDSKCSGIQRVRGESNASGDANSERDEPKQVFLKSDPIAKYGDQLAVSWVKAGDRRSLGDGLLISVLKDGTVIAAGDSNRNRECQIKLTASQFDELLKEMDEVDHCFDLAPDGEHVIKPGQPYNQWDHGADWLRIRRGQKEIHVGLVGSWNVGQEEHTPGVSTFRKVMARLYPLINVTRAGGWDEIERLLPIANAVLKQSFPELPPLTAKDFSSSERFQYPARSIYFRRMGADGEKFGVELERRDDGTVNPISVWNGGDVRDVEKPLVVRGLDLAKIPFTKEWKEMEKLRVLTDSGYTFKPEYVAYEVAPETWACYLPKEDKFYIEVGNNQRRRKLHGPITGNPLKVLNPPPVPEKTDNAAANANRQRDLSLADLVRVFNDENQQLRQGLNQLALTEDEVIAVIKRDKWQRKDSPLNEQEITAFKAVAESKRLPEYAHLHLETEDETETFVWKKLWRVRLMLPAIGRDGHVSLTIRDTKVAEEKIDSKQVAWGKPDAEGLTLGIYLSPRKAQYAIGDRVRLRFLIRNNGQQPVKTMWLGMSVPMPDAFTVTDQTGAKVAVNIGHKNWDSPWATLFKNEMLGVGEVHGLTVPYEISIGGAGSKNSLIGRVINARPGQKLQLKVRELNGSTRQVADEESESGTISFIVVEGPIDPNAGLPNSDEDTNPTNNTSTTR